MEELITIVLKAGELFFDFVDTVSRKLFSESTDDEQGLYSEMFDSRRAGAN